MRTKENAWTKEEDELILETLRTYTRPDIVKKCSSLVTGRTSSAISQRIQLLRKTNGLPLPRKDKESRKTKMRSSIGPYLVTSAGLVGERMSHFRVSIATPNGEILEYVAELPSYSFRDGSLTETAIKRMCAEMICQKHGVVNLITRINVLEKSVQSLRDATESLYDNLLQIRRNTSAIYELMRTEEDVFYIYRVLYSTMKSYK